MDIVAKFLVYFGSAFLGVGVVMLSFLRRRMVNHSRMIKKKKRIEKFFGNQNNSNNINK